MEEKLIFKKIPLIMQEIEPIAKGRKNQQQGYSYRGVDDVMNSLAPILSKHGVFPITTIEETTHSESIVSKAGTAGYHMLRVYSIRLYAEDGSFVEGRIEGEASDFGDKAAGKAHSYAYRDFLMKTFCIPTEGDHDTDAVTPDIKPQQPAKQDTVKSDQNIQGLTGKPVMNDKILSVMIERAKNGEDGIFQKMISHYHVNDEQIAKFQTAINSK